MNLDKQEIKASASKVVNLGFLSYLTKNKFTIELRENLIEKKSFRSTLNGIFTVFDAMLHYLKLDVQKHLNANKLAYLMHIIARGYLENKGLSENEQSFIKFSLGVTTQLENLPSYTEHLQIIRTEVAQILGELAIDTDYFSREIEEQIAQFLSKKTQVQNFTTVVQDLISHLSRKISVYHYCFVTNNVKTLVRITCIVTSRIYEKKNLVWQEIQSDYTAIYNDTCKPQDERFYNMVLIAVQEFILSAPQRNQKNQNNPFTWLPPEVQAEINQFLAPSHNNTLDHIAYRDLLHFSAVSKQTHSMVMHEATGTWSTLFKQIFPDHLGKLFCRKTNFYQGYIDNSNQTIKHNELVKDLCRSQQVKTRVPFLKTIFHKNNVILDYFYLRDILVKKILTNLTNNDQNFDFVGGLLKVAMERLTQNHLPFLFIVSRFLQELLERDKNNRFLAKAQAIIETFSSEGGKSKMKAVDFIDSFLQNKLLEIASFVFDAKVPVSFDFNQLKPWLFGLIFEPEKTKRVFLQIYTEMKKFQEVSEEACLALSQCSNPLSVLQHMNDNHHFGLLHNKTWQAQAITSLDNLAADQAAFFFKFYTPIVKVGIAQNSLKLFANIKKLYSLKDFVTEENLLQVCQKGNHFINLICLMDGERLLDVMEFQSAFAKLHPAIQPPAMHAAIFICYYRIEKEFLESQNLALFEKVFKNINSFFDAYHDIKNVMQKIKMLLSPAGREILELFDYNNSLLCLLSHDTKLFLNLLKPDHADLVKYLRVTKLQPTNLPYLVKHPRLFIENKLPLSAISNAIVGVRMNILRDFPGRFETWTAEQIKEFFSYGNQRTLSGSIFNANVLEAMNLFFKEYKEELKFEDLKVIAVQELWRFFQPFRVKSFIFLYKNLPLADIVQLSKTVVASTNILTTLLKLSDENLIDIFTFLKNDVQAIQNFLGSPVFELYLNSANTNFFKELYQVLGLPGMITLHQTSLDKNKTILQALLLFESNAIRKCVEDACGNVDILITNVRTYVAQLDMMLQLRRVEQQKSQLPSPVSELGFFNSHKRKNEDDNNSNNQPRIEDRIETSLREIKKMRTEGRDENIAEILKEIQSDINLYLQDLTKGASLK